MTQHINLRITSMEPISEMDVLYSFQELNKCSVQKVIIYEDKSGSSMAIVFVDQWYPGTDIIREILSSGRHLTIRNTQTNRIWLLFAYDTNENVGILDSDELPPNVTDNRAQRLQRRPPFMESLPPNVTDNRAQRLRRENTDGFQTPPKTGATRPVPAPNAPVKATASSYEQDLSNVARNLNEVFV
jgi:hypothetical protein